MGANDVDVSNYSAKELISYGDSYATTAFEKRLVSMLKEVIDAPVEKECPNCGISVEYCIACGSSI